MANPTITFNTKLNQAGALKDARTLRDNLGRPIDIKLNTRSLAQPLGRITGDVAEFTKSLQAATARVTAFGATSGGIIAVSQAISMVAKSVIEVDKQLIELNTFLGQSQSGLKSIGDSLFKVAKNTASSFADTAEAAKEFARQGLSVEETLKRTNDALVLSRISGLGAADSVNALTTAINSFNKSGLDSAEIVNKLVKVDSNFAVSAADLAQALTRVGSAAQDSGVGFEELIAVVTTAQQTTGRGGAIIGNALKTIFTRLKRPEVLDQLQQLGVAVKDQNGALLSGTQILTNYISATKNLGQVEKARNDELLGGVYQINQLKAITNDLAKANGIYARSLQIANSATDDATKKNDELNKSLSAVIQNTKTNFEKRGGSIGEPLIKPLVKRAAGVTNFVLDNLGLDKASADKEGKDIGATFGQSLLKGIGEAAAGPGLILFGALVINIGKRLVSFVADASKVLLNINSTAANAQAIEQAINNTLAQQPKITKAILSGQLTREQAASQLLRVFTLQNQQLMLQKGLSSSIAQSFSRSGYIASPEIGIYKKTPRKASGYIPSFAAEKREAMSYGASPNVQPYMTKAVIKGVPQDVVVNTGETIIPNFAGGRDTAIIPNYAKGNVPNFAGKQFNVNSSAGFRTLLQKNAQKITNIKYITENGVVENLDPKQYRAQFGPAVRRDEYKGQPPPKGFKSWQEFREATNTISIRTTSGERKTFRADRILQVNAMGNSFMPSATLKQANDLTSPFNAKTLRGMGIENVTKVNTALANPSFFETASSKDISSTLAKSTRRRNNPNLASGYIPNFAAGRYMSPSSRPSSRVGKSAEPVVSEASASGRTKFTDAIGSAVTTAIYFALPSALSGFANENNQSTITKTLQASAIAAPIIGALKGFATGGPIGAVTGLIGGGITGGVLASQASSIEGNVKSDIFEKARDKALNGFNKLTGNIGDLTQTISDLDALYADPNARPDGLIKLGKKEQDLLKKISLNNPEAAIAYKSAGTPVDKQEALTTAKEAAQKEASISKSVLDFSELDKAKRDAKAVTSFFADLAGQLDTDKVDISSLNSGNINEFLKKGGIGKTAGVFSNEESGKQLTDSFIKFLNNQEKIVNLNKTTEAKLAEVKKPLIDLQGKVEAAQGLRAASKEARGGYLENVSRFAGNFGERAGIEGQSIVSKYNLSRPEKETFANRLSVESRNLTKGSFAQAAVGNLSGESPSAALGTKIQSIINASPNASAKDLEILKRILTENITSTRKLENIEKISNVQKDYALKNLSLQEKLSFGGGIKTSIDASSKIDSIKNTQRGALQYQLGSTFGSKETQIGGLANFATNLKDKYAGLFEGEGGKQAFGGIADLLTELRASDIKQSLSRDASTARSMGQFGLAGQLESKLDPRNQGQIYDMARLQSEQQLGITPTGLLNQTTNELRGADAKDRAAKMGEDASLKGLEDLLKPAINRITTSFVEGINEIQGPLKASLETAFGKGVEISNATLIAKNLDLSSILGGKESKSKLEEGGSAAPTKEEISAKRAELGRSELGLAGGFIPNFSQSAISDAVDREKTALTQRGISASVVGGSVPNFAKINIEQSDKLMNRSNPMGFAVTNSVDEPRGLSSIGLAAKGFIPNFAFESDKGVAKDFSLLPDYTKTGGFGPLGELEKKLSNIKPNKIDSVKLAAQDKKVSSGKQRKTIKKVIDEAANKPSEKVRKPAPEVKKSIVSSMESPLSLPEPESNFEKIATLRASRLLKEQQKIASQQQLKNELILEQMEKGPFEKQYRALLREEARANVYGPNLPKSSIFADSPLEASLRISAQEAALGKNKNPLSTSSGGVSGVIAKLEKEMERRQGQIGEQRLAKIEARRRGNISPTVPKFLPPADPKFIKPTVLDIEGSSPLFKKAGPGLLFTGSFGGPAQTTRDLLINTTEGFNTAKALLESNPELAKSILGDNFADILRSRSAFKKWNKSQGETIVGVKNDGSSLVAKLTTTEQRQASQAINAGLATAARAARAAGGGGAGAGGAFGGAAGGGGAGAGGAGAGGAFGGAAGGGGAGAGGAGAGGAFGGGAGGAGGGFGGGAGGWRGAARAGSGPGGGFSSYFAANSAATATGNAAPKKQDGLFGGLSGYVSKKDINRKAVELLNLDRSLIESKLSSESKDYLVKEFLNELGPFQSQVREESNQLLNEQNRSKVKNDIRKKYAKAFNPNTGQVVLGNISTGIGASSLFDSVTKDIRKAVSDGNLTPEQGAKLQNEIYMDTFKALPNEYGDLLKRKNLSTNSLGDFYSSEASTTFRDQLKTKATLDDLTLLNKNINKNVGYEIDPATGKQIGSTSKRGSNWRSFSQYVLDQTAAINKNPSLTAQEKSENIQKLRRERVLDELSAKRQYAKNRGFEYDPLTGEVSEKGSRKQASKNQAETAESISEAKNYRSKAVGLAGSFYGLYGTYKTIKEGEGNFADFAQAGLSGAGAIASLPVKRLVDKFGGEKLGKFAGGALGVAGAIGHGEEAVKQYNEGNYKKAALSGLEAVASAGAGAASILGQHLASRRGFTAGAALGVGKNIFYAKNKQTASASTLTGGILATLTGQSFEGYSELSPKQKEMVWENAIGDVAGSAFGSVDMGRLGPASQVFKVGYRAGNIIEENLGIGEKLGDMMSGGIRGILDPKDVNFSRRRNGTREDFGVQRDNSIAILKKSEDELTDEEKAYKAYLQKELKQGLSLNQYKDYNFRLSDIPGSSILDDQFAGGFIPNFAAPKKYSKKFLLEAQRKRISAETLEEQLYGLGKNPNDKNRFGFSENDALLAVKRGVSAETIAKERRGETEDPNKENKFGFSQIDAQIASLRGVSAETIAKERESALNKKIGLPSSDSDGVFLGGDYYTPEQIKAANNAKVSVETFVERNSAPKNVLIGGKSFSPDQIKQAADSGVSVETLVGRKNSSNEPTLIGGKSFSSDQIRQAANTGVSVESLSAKSEADLDAKIKGIKTGLNSDSLQYASPEERAALKEKYDKLKGGLTGSASEEIDLPSKANGLIPNFAVSKEMDAIKNSPAYAGYRNAMPTMSSVYGDKVINSAEIEVPAKEVYARMFGPAGYGMSPKNPSETHAILNPAQQSALGYAGGFVPNFSNDKFASMMSEAMKNGMASFMADGFMPAASNSNVVNINDNRNVQSSIEANPGVFDEVMQVLMKMHPKEMAAIGPKITKVR